MRQKAAAGVVLDELAEEIGGVWRTLPDGSIWIGVDSWEETSVPYEILDELGAQGSISIALESAALLPGTTLGGRKIVQITHQLSAEKWRTDVCYSQRYFDSLRSVLAGIVAGLTRRFDYHALYPCRVIKQNDDGTLELKPDGDRVPPTSKVPLRYAVPGMLLKVKKDARVLLGFEQGDKRRPYASLWEIGELETLQITASKSLTLNAPEVLLKQ